MSVDVAKRSGTRPPSGSPLRWAVADALAVARRNLITMRRVPRLLVFSTVQPVIFVLMFRYAFGGAISTPGLRYVDYLMPGIFVQTVAFGALNTATGLAEDVQKGIIERFRSLPMARSAVLAGRLLSDLARSVFVIGLMCLVGFAVGFRVHTSAARFLGAMLLLLLFSCALSAVFALIGLSVDDGETAQAARFPVLAPLVFASSAFGPVASMPGWLQPFADNQPVSAAVDAIRRLSAGGPASGAVVKCLAWSLALLAVFGPLAVSRYRRTR